MYWAHLKGCPLVADETQVAFPWLSSQIAQSSSTYCDLIIRIANAIVKPKLDLYKMSTITAFQMTAGKQNCMYMKLNHGIWKILQNFSSTVPLTAISNINTKGTILRTNFCFTTFYIPLAAVRKLAQNVFRQLDFLETHEEKV